MNKTVDGSKAVRHRFNAADVVVILLVLLCIGGAVWLFGGSGIFGSGKSVALEYEILVVDIRYTMSNRLDERIDFNDWSGADVLYLYSTLLLNRSLSLK